ncbi:MAG TPA: hypothetical protein VKT77_08610 [Chthonomonadaceae bacterium]|nr:hypothetical protein [Chthonomonadaceae bacterium]
MAHGILIPPCQVVCLRQPWQDAMTAFARPAMIVHQALLRAVSVTRVVWRRLTGARDSTRPQQGARHRRTAPVTPFEKQYDNLVDTLCAAAHEGVTPERERRYRRARAWMRTHYPFVACKLRGYWAAPDNRETDPFTPLFASAQLVEAINADNAIDDMMRSRAALEAYRADIDRQPLGAA